MAVLREKGYEFKKWKLGEKVRIKKNGKVYEIIGFDEGEDVKLFIAINCNEWDKNIKDSFRVTSYIDCDSNYYEWVSKDEIEKIEKEDDTKKKDVLKLEFAGVFDRVACRIVYQDDVVFKRGEFRDHNINVFSIYAPDFSLGKLFIRGLKIERDNHVFVVSKEEAEVIKQKVKQINEKYGIKKRWRAEKNESYWFVSFDCLSHLATDDFSHVDKEYYELGNYFKTREQAEEACRRVKEVLKQYQEELLKEE